MNADADAARHAGARSDDIRMIAFTLPQSHYLLAHAAEEAIGVGIGELSVGRFPNGELHVDLATDVQGQPCAVLGALAAPDDQVLGLLLLADTLKRHGARSVTAGLSYLGYARQDHLEPRRSLAAAWMAGLVAASGVDEVITLDVHSDAAAAPFGARFKSLSPAPLFAAELERLGLRDASLVAPDAGARARCEAVAAAAGIASPIAFLHKRRTAEGIAHGDLVGDVGGSAVLIDDILDTGGTLVSACRELRKHGVEDITVMVTHGLFIGERWKALLTSGARRVLCTDSVPEMAVEPPPGVGVLPIGSLLLHELRARASQ